MSRALSESLAAHGVEISVIVPRFGSQQAVENIGGVTIRGFSPFDIREACRLIRSSQADVFHSQDPTLLTVLAQSICPDAVHVVTCRDPRDTHDWLIEFRDATWGRRKKIPLNWLLEGSPIIRRAVRRADGVYTPAYYLQEKVCRMCRPKTTPGLLPNLIDVPVEEPQKSATPVLTLIGRLDKRKRPELFLELAARFPEWRFVVVGRAESEERDRDLQKRYGTAPNVTWEGYVDRFNEPERLQRILSDTWILVNTASREGLPLTFLEAAGYGCAIVSAVDPDGFPQRFGVHVEDDDFGGKLSTFLEDPERVLAAGRAARAYVQSTYERERATEIHLEVYEQHLKRKAHR